VAPHKHIGSTRSLNAHASNLSSSLPNIAELIGHGQITIGTIGPVGPVAVASDGRNTLVMLVHRDDESLEALLTRLDQEIKKLSTKEFLPTRSIADNWPSSYFTHRCQYGLLRTLTLQIDTIRCCDTE
jgi:ABC-type taurine transport system substrate-binding protein